MFSTTFLRFLPKHIRTRAYCLEMSASLSIISNKLTSNKNSSNALLPLRANSLLLWLHKPYAAVRILLKSSDISLTAKSTSKGAICSLRISRCFMRNRWPFIESWKKCQTYINVEHTNQMLNISPLQPYISIQVLILFSRHFLMMELARRICLTIKSLLRSQSFPSFSWP